jgi:hypothetical protein
MSDQAIRGFNIEAENHSAGVLYLLDNNFPAIKSPCRGDIFFDYLIVKPLKRLSELGVILRTPVKTGGYPKQKKH